MMNRYVESGVKQHDHNPVLKLALVSTKRCKNKINKKCPWNYFLPELLVNPGLIEMIQIVH
jgi:hypothetical protein